ncbi:MAG: methyltransferase family protein [Planctomycetota bacterium]|jgi:protein-S-isoprenylcysteine O-methyltransferase Ste14
MPASKRLTVRRFIVYVCCLGILLLARPHPVLYPIGLVFIAAGESLRIWACGYLRKNQDVIMSGPFAHVKNPLYVGTFLIMTGFCFAASNPNEPSRWVLYVAYPVFFLAFFFYYMPKKVRIEGDRLRRRFGEKFEDYDRNVPDFVPRLSPYRPNEDVPKLTWEAGLLTENSEYGTLGWVVAGSLVIFSKFFFELWA